MRSVWKGPFIDNNILDEIYKLYKSNKRKVPIKIVSKNSVIFPSFVGLTFFISNGKKFTTLTINENMVGHKFGEFVVTKKYPIHKKSK
jgi:small subunit ribosomal protein S19